MRLVATCKCQFSEMETVLALPLSLLSPQVQNSLSLGVLSLKEVPLGGYELGNIKTKNGYVILPSFVIYNQGNYPTIT